MLMHPRVDACLHYACACSRTYARVHMCAQVCICVRIRASARVQACVLTCVRARVTEPLWETIDWLGGWVFV